MNKLEHSFTSSDCKVEGCEGSLQEISLATGPPNPRVREIVARYEGQTEALRHRPGGETQVDLEGQQVRERETNLGNFVAGIMRKTAGAEADLINGGTVRTGIARGHEPGLDGAHTDGLKISVKKDLTGNRYGGP